MQCVNDIKGCGAALLHHLHRSCRVRHFDRTLRVILVKGELSLLVYVHAEFVHLVCPGPYVLNRCVCLAVHLCARYRCTSPLLTPRLFNCVGSAPFIPCLAFSLKREKPQGTSRDKSDDMTVLAGFGIALCD